MNYAPFNATSCDGGGYMNETSLDSLCTSDNEHISNDLSDIMIINQSLLDIMNGKHHTITPITDDVDDDIKTLLQTIKEKTGHIKIIQDELSDIDERFQKAVRDIESKMKVVDNMIHFIKNNPVEIADEPLLTSIIHNMKDLSKHIEENQTMVDIKKEYAEKKQQLQPYLSLISSINQLNHSHICALCLTNPVSHFMNPCGHTYCKECLDKTENPSDNKIKECSFCRGRIHSTHNLYFL